MNVDAFIADRERSWAELDALVRRAGGRPERLAPPDVLRLGTLYRAAAADLAFARRVYPREPVVERVAEMVGTARHIVYDVEPRRETLRSFLTTGYWQRVRERPGALALSTLLLFGPAALALLWALRDPATAGGMVPGAYRAVTQPRPSGSLGLPLSAQTAFSSLIFTNNIKVTFFAFAGGIAAGLVTAYVLIQNGVMIGLLGGLATGAGNGRIFVELVTAHGVLELSCIVVSGAAGLRLGGALVRPRRVRRSVVLVEEGRRTVELVLGTAPWLVVAGLVEGYITPRVLGIAPVLVIGFGLGTVYWTLVVWRGRSEPSA